MDKTTDAIKILHDRYIGNDPERLKYLEEERKVAERERAEEQAEELNQMVAAALSMTKWWRLGDE